MTQGGSYACNEWNGDFTCVGFPTSVRERDAIEETYSATAIPLSRFHWVKRALVVRFPRRTP
jgi:hypothetical protein